MFRDSYPASKGQARPQDRPQERAYSPQAANYNQSSTNVQQPAPSGLRQPFQPRSNISNATSADPYLPPAKRQKISDGAIPISYMTLCVSDISPVFHSKNCRGSAARIWCRSYREKGRSVLFCLCSPSLCTSSRQNSRIEAEPEGCIEIYRRNGCK
jgi:hypothetical protein